VGGYFIRVVVGTDHCGHISKHCRKCNMEKIVLWCGPKHHEVKAGL